MKPGSYVVMDCNLGFRRGVLLDPRGKIIRNPPLPVETVHESKEDFIRAVTEAAKEYDLHVVQVGFFLLLLNHDH